MRDAQLPDDIADTFDRLVRVRRSIRGFRPDPVPPEVLQRVFEAAQHSPSNCNVQPWVVHVVTGQSAERMRRGLEAEAAANNPKTPDVPLTGPYVGVYRERRIASAVALFEATGVARHDLEARNESFMRNFRFFDAPCAAFLFAPSWAGLREIADVGMYAQSLMLALTANGLGSCPQGALSHYAHVVHDQLGVPEDMHLLFGLAFGYPDESHPANRAITDREPALDAVTIHP